MRMKGDSLRWQLHNTSYLGMSCAVLTAVHYSISANLEGTFLRLQLEDLSTITNCCINLEVFTDPP